LLKDGRRRAWRTNLVPTHTYAGASDDTMVSDEGFVIAEVAISEPEHNAVAKRVELLRGARLRDARAATTSFTIRRYRKRRRAGQRCVRWIVPIDVELPEREVVVAYAQRKHVVRRASRRLPRTVQVGGQQAPVVGAHIEALLGSCLPRQHLRPVIGADPAA